MHRQLSDAEVRMADAIDAADCAFWAAIARAYPSVRYGDMDPLTIDRWREGCRAAVESWLESNLPPLERLHDELLDHGFAPTWGDEGGTSLWVSLIWPAETFTRRIEIENADDGDFRMTLVEDAYNDRDGRVVALPTVAGDQAAEVIYDFANITRTAFDHDNSDGRA